MRISLVIPVYNEASHLETVLAMLDNLSLGKDAEKELIFVDDASSDSSLTILKSFSFKSSLVKIHSQTKNQGKGAAIHEGFRLATGDIIGVQDADFEYDPSEIPSLIAPILQDKADVVYGSRFKKNAPQVHRTFHYLVNRLLTLLSNALSGLYLTDMETCYKFFKSEIIKNVTLESRRFGFEPEITAKVARLKCRVHEYPISYFPRNYIDGKKITWKDGVAAFRHILVFNVFRSPKSYVGSKMPRKYIPSGNQWL